MLISPLFLKNYFFKKDIYYVVEKNKWIIMQLGKHITDNLNKAGLRAGITLTQSGIFNSIVHYGSINIFYPGINKVNIPHKTNKIVVTFFHVVPEDERLKSIKDIMGYVDIWHTATSITKENLIKIGIPEEKIVVIPVGIDLNLFKPISEEAKNELRLKLKIPKESIVIGSFQKDGVGWEAGDEPKLIKGPDIFCKVVKALAKKYPVFILLTGPARGYVKNQLENEKIPYRHLLVEYSDLPKFYGILDFYLVTSRIEGVPMAILECMATSTPFVTTKVGIVLDLVRDHENGLVCDVDDLEGLIKNSEIIIKDNFLKKRLSYNMANDIRRYSWENITGEYVRGIYSKL